MILNISEPKFVGAVPLEKAYDKAAIKQGYLNNRTVTVLVNAAMQFPGDLHYDVQEKKWKIGEREIELEPSGKWMAFRAYFGKIKHFVLSRLSKSYLSAFAESLEKVSKAWIKALKDVEPPKIQENPLASRFKEARMELKEMKLDVELQEEVSALMDEIEEDAQELMKACDSKELLEDILSGVRLDLRELISTALQRKAPPPKVQSDVDLLVWQKQLRSIVLEVKKAPSEELTQKFSDLISQRKEDINQTLQFAISGNFLHFLAKRGKPLEFVVILAKQGISFDAQDHWGNTPLLWAVANGRNEMAQEIIKYPQNLDIQDKLHYKNTALHLAIAKGYRDMTQNGKLLTVSNLMLVEKMLEMGSSVNIANGDGNTPLHLACLRRDPQMVQAILNKTPNTELRNKEGMTPKEMFAKTFEEASLILKNTAFYYALDKETFEKNLEAMPKFD